MARSSNKSKALLTSTVSIDVMETLKSEAANKHQTVSSIVRSSINAYLEDGVNRPTEIAVLVEARSYVESRYKDGFLSEHDYQYLSDMLDNLFKLH